MIELKRRSAYQLGCMKSLSGGIVSKLYSKLFDNHKVRVPMTCESNREVFKTTEVIWRNEAIFRKSLTTFETHVRTVGKSTGSTA